MLRRSVYNINWIYWVGDRVRYRLMALSDRPIYRGLTTTMSAVSLGCTQPPPDGFRGERCYILWRTVPKQKQMRQAFAPDLAAAKTKRKPHGWRGGLKG